MHAAAVRHNPVVSARRAVFTSNPKGRWARLKLRTLTAFLHLMQPVARLRGRLRLGLTPWRRRGWSGYAFPRRRTATVWREEWRAPENWLGEVVPERRQSQQGDPRRPRQEAGLTRTLDGTHGTTVGPGPGRTVAQV